MMAVSLDEIARQRSARLREKVFHVGPSVAGPRPDAVPADDLPTHPTGARSVPRSCQHCGGGLLSVEPPMGQHTRGMVSCTTCGRQLCWLAPIADAARFPVSEGPTSGRNARIALAGRVNVSSPSLRLVQFEPTPGCGPRCSSVAGHDALAHESYGRRLAVVEATARPSGIVRAGALVIDCDSMAVEADGAVVPLTDIESRIVVYLASRLGQPCRLAEVAAAVWGVAEVDIMASTRSQHGAWHRLRVNVTRIRRKLAAHAGMLEVVKNVGYRLRREPTP